MTLACANLWAHLFLVSPEWTDELLRRSKTVPLVVRIDFSDTIPNPGLILKKTLGHMERNQDLQIVCLPEYMEQMLRSRITAPAPLLRSLRLSFDRNSDSTFIFSKDMFLGRMPNLCLVDWTSPIFSGLAELALHSMLDDSLDNWVGLLFVLKNCHISVGLLWWIRWKMLLTFRLSISRIWTSPSRFLNWKSSL